MRKLKILAAADSHGQHSLLRRAIGQEAPVDILVHAGDVEGSLKQILGEHTEYEIRAVSGNMDWSDEYPPELCFEAGGIRFFVTHGHRYGVHSTKERLLEAARENEARIAVFGHTHMPYLLDADGVTLLNPGSIAKPRQAGWKKTYAVIEIPLDDSGLPAGEPEISIRSLKGKGILY